MEKDEHKDTQAHEVVGNSQAIPKRVIDTVLSIAGVGIAGDEDVLKPKILQRWLEK